MRTLSIMLLTVMMISCADKEIQSNTAKETETRGEEKKEMTKDELILAGYMAVEVHREKTKSAPCDWYFEIESRKMILEVMEFPKELKTEGLDVWLKFSRQRRQSQCGGNAQPIEIIDFKLMN